MRNQYVRSALDCVPPTDSLGPGVHPRPDHTTRCTDLSTASSISWFLTAGRLLRPVRMAASFNRLARSAPEKPDETHKHTQGKTFTTHIPQKAAGTPM